MTVIRVVKIPEFQQRLLAWYDANARDLPWRRTSDPYRIWVSEIMLQQTRVAAVLEHYARFLKLFPSVGALAVAREQDVLAAWSGLGYYRRAKFMHRAAQYVIRECGGSLPRTTEALRRLPGVGEYTSAAIASIAFGEKVAVVDGNVERVILRLFLSAEQSPEKAAPARWICERAAELLAAKRPGDFNQAMMELGATLCLPKNPICLQCPVYPFCSTRGARAAPPREKMRSRKIGYALVRRKRSGLQQILLAQRPQSASSMPGMWELPEVTVQQRDGERIELLLRHAITVTNYQVSVLTFSEEEGRQRLARSGRRKWAKTSELGKLPLTGLARKVLERLQMMPRGSMGG